MSSKQRSKKEFTIDTTIEELKRQVSQPDAIVNSRIWINIPNLIRDCDLKEERNMHKMERLMQSILHILNECVKNEMSLINRRMLHSSLSTLANSPNLPKAIRVCVGQCLLSLDSFEDGPLVLVETDEFKSMEEVNRLLASENSLMEQSRAKLELEMKKREREQTEAEQRKKIDTEEATRKAEMRIRSAEEGKRIAEERRRQAEEQIGQAQRDKDKLADEVKRTREELRKMRGGMESSERYNERLADEVKRTREELREARGRIEQSESEKREMAVKMERMRTMLRTEWTGTESLQTFDRTAHTLSPTTITQTIAFKEGSTDWRTAYTFPIDEGEWEFKIRYPNQAIGNNMLGFVRFPLVANASQRHIGSLQNGIGSAFNLANGSMYENGTKVKPEGTNSTCLILGETAAIRVNMWTREARLFVYGKEQPWFFTNFPSPLCIGISTGALNQYEQVEVVWLKRLR
ncbi:hypothetical protein BLNAU_22729 [Blattamonas nauphoetae]|uniref:Uncharacterized protein n=1 Tax=Blattamonas nauphoetae TaxID=2049346 RepID=A0ABQ9WUD8_9EUKA|nr:hypothetical protein BLNAU_22729 [Blattamonas nauphoetae]